MRAHFAWPIKYIASYTPGCVNDEVIIVNDEVIIVNVITSWLEMGPYMTYMYQYIAPLVSQYSDIP